MWKPLSLLALLVSGLGCAILPQHHAGNTLAAVAYINIKTGSFSVCGKRSVWNYDCTEYPSLVSMVDGIFPMQDLHIDFDAEGQPVFTIHERPRRADEWHR